MVPPKSRTKVQKTSSVQPRVPLPLSTSTSMNSFSSSPLPLSWSPSPPSPSPSALPLLVSGPAEPVIIQAPLQSPNPSVQSVMVPPQTPCSSRSQEITSENI